jgi:hypothetical protein
MLLVRSKEKDVARAKSVFVFSYGVDPLSSKKNRKLALRVMMSIVCTPLWGKNGMI